MPRADFPVLFSPLRQALDRSSHRRWLCRIALYAKEGLVQEEPVAGAVLIGRITPLPQLDLYVFVNSEFELNYEMPQFFRGIGLDPDIVSFDANARFRLRYRSIPRLSRELWSENLKFVLSQGVMVADPEDSIRTFLENRLWYPNALRQHRLQDNARRLEAFFSERSIESRLRRKEYSYVAHLLTTALDRVMAHLFDFNHVWRPAPRKRILDMDCLRYVPQGFVEQLNRISRLPAGQGSSASPVHDDVAKFLQEETMLHALYTAIQREVEEEPWWRGVNSGSNAGLGMG